MIEIRNIIDREEFDYQTLLSALGAYANPRMKISSMLKKGQVVRVKKGLYVFGDAWRRRPYVREILANLIFGPSVVSGDYVLAKCGLIPESVPTVTSSTVKRPHRFETPVGVFEYRQVPAALYAEGAMLADSPGGQYFSAVPERALVDKIRDDRGSSVKTLVDARQYLFDDLRLDEDAFYGLDVAVFKRCADASGSAKAGKCAALLQRNARDGYTGD